jgi:co-chaperonin GroES (HSP10)
MNMSKQIVFEGENIPVEKLPVPSGWRLLVGMVKIETKTAGGIVLTDEHVKGQEYLRSVGKVLAVGSECYRHPKFQGGIPIESRDPEPWVKVGDVVLVGQYSGQAIKCLDGTDAQTLKLLNDDEILAIIQDINILDR